MYGWGACVICTAQHRVGLVQRLQCNLLAQWPRYNLHRQISPKRGGTVQGVLQPICDPGVKCAACCSPLQRQLFGGKSWFVEGVVKGRYNPRLESRACLKSNSMKATAYKNFLQRRSVQIKAKQWTHGTGFEKLWKFGGSLGYRIRHHIIQYF